MNLSDAHELSIDEVKSLRSRLRSDITPRHLDIIVQYDELIHRAMLVPGDLIVHGDLDMNGAEIQVLIVEGNLVVEGRLEDRNDEENESLILVQGDLRARDLFSWGTLEVHGDLHVERHLLLLDNACITHVEGDVRADFLFDQDHHCRVDGDVRARMVVQDSAHIETSNELEFIEPEGEKIGQVLERGVLVGEEDEEGFYAESIDTDALMEWIRADRSVFLVRPTSSS